MPLGGRNGPYFSYRTLRNASRPASGRAGSFFAVLVALLLGVVETGLGLKNPPLQRGLVEEFLIARRDLFSAGVVCSAEDLGRRRGPALQRYACLMREPGIEDRRRRALRSAEPFDPLIQESPDSRRTARRSGRPCAESRRRRANGPVRAPELRSTGTQTRAPVVPCWSPAAD